MTTVDLTPAAERMAGLLAQISDDQLALATPCPDYTLADLVEHVGGLALAFTAAATKSSSSDSQGAPVGDGTRLPPDWRDRIPHDLDALAAAWREPSAWTGMTSAGSIDMPGEIAGLVALQELVMHGWDVARAIGADYAPDSAELTTVHDFVAGFPDDARGDAFGLPVRVAAEAPLLDRVVALSGRDPAWGS